MQTSDLIENLAKNVRPTPSRARVLGAAIAIGAVIAGGCLLLLLGLRSDLPQAIWTDAFWMKWGFTVGTAAAAFGLCVHLARPEGSSGWIPLVLVVPFIVLGAVGCLQMASAPHSARGMMWLGQTAIQCPWCIALFAVPFLVGILWAFRFFAPTRLRLAGFAAGLLAGAAAAVIYALSCDETSPAFVATWYSAGMLVPALVGGVIGPRVLRW